jgi:hypothetical protein
MFADEQRQPSKSRNLVDFGLATQYRLAECKSMTEKVGTIYTITAPVHGVRMIWYTM